MNNKAIVLIVVIIILAIMGVAIYMFTSNNNEDLANANEPMNNVGEKFYKLSKFQEMKII